MVQVSSKLALSSTSKMPRLIDNAVTYIILTNVLSQLSYAESLYYSKMAGIRCESQVDIGNLNKVKCAVICAQHRALKGSPCKAFNISNSVCTLCLNGPVSRTKQVIWSSTEKIFAVAVKDLAGEMQKG